MTHGDRSQQKKPVIFQIMVAKEMGIGQLAAPSPARLQSIHTAGSDQTLAPPRDNPCKIRGQPTFL